MAYEFTSKQEVSVVVLFLYPGNSLHINRLLQTQRMAEDGDEDSTAQRVNAPIQQEPGPLPQGWLLLEEEKGRQKH